MRIESNIKEWLESAPGPEDIREKDGAKYIPYHIIVDKLNYLTGGEWSAKNFTFHTCSLPDRRIMVTGSVDVEVTYEATSCDLHIKRTLSGAATFLLSKNGNPHPAASVKSLAIMNAVKPLGPQFGWGLNGFETESTYFPDEETEEPLPVIDRGVERIRDLIQGAQTLEELAGYKKSFNGDFPKELVKVYADKVKALSKV